MYWNLFQCSALHLKPQAAFMLSEAGRLVWQSKCVESESRSDSVHCRDPSCMFRCATAESLLASPCLRKL
jgi:hypothetical protein